MWGTLTQLNDNGQDTVIAYHSKKLSESEKIYTASDSEVLSLILFLQSFRCYLEGSEFEISTHNQVLKTRSKMTWAISKFMYS